VKKQKLIYEGKFDRWCTKDGRKKNEIVVVYPIRGDEKILDQSRENQNQQNE